MQPGIPVRQDAPRWGVVLPRDVPVAGVATFAETVARAGFSDLWVGESDGPEAFIPLTLAAAATDQLRLGTAVVPAATRGRALLAMTIAGLASAAPGRCAVGLGASAPAILAGWNDRAPATTRRDLAMLLDHLRRTLRGQEAPGGFRLAAVPETCPPLLLAALRPRMAALAASEADGIVLTSVAPADVAAVLAPLRPSARDFEVVTWVTVAVTDDHERAAALARARVQPYLAVPAYAAFHRWLGRDPLDPAVALELVLIGSPERCRAGLAAYADAGATTVLIEPLPGLGDPVATLEALAPGTHAARR